MAAYISLNLSSYYPYHIIVLDSPSYYIPLTSLAILFLRIVNFHFSSINMPLLKPLLLFLVQVAQEQIFTVLLDLLSMSIDDPTIL